MKRIFGEIFVGLVFASLGCLVVSSLLYSDAEMNEAIVSVKSVLFSILS